MFFEWLTTPEEGGEVHGRHGVGALGVVGVDRSGLAHCEAEVVELFDGGGGRKGVGGEAEAAGGAVGGQFECRCVDGGMVEFVHEGGGEVVVGVVTEFVVDPEPFSAGDDGAADDEVGAFHLFVVVAGVAAAHRGSGDAEAFAEGRCAG